MTEVITASIGIFGSAGVGKTSLVQRFVSDKMQEEYVPTVEEVYCREVSVGGKKVIVKITDTGGSSDLRLKWDSALKQCNGFIVVYDITKMDSFKEVEHFKGLLLLMKPDSYDTPVVVVGNKCDLEDRREVATVVAAALAHQLSCPFFETSAVTGKNVDKAFKKVVLEKHKINKWSIISKGRPRKACCSVL